MSELRGLRRGEVVADQAARFDDWTSRLWRYCQCWSHLRLMDSSWLRLLAILLSTSIALPLEKAEYGARDGRAAIAKSFLSGQLFEK